jgi:glycosyltransferase involved in cell wall biosynthesis
VSLTCIIPAYRATATIGRAVRCCLSDSAIDTVIVIVDGPDAELEAAVPRHPGVRLIVSPVNEGAPAARNTALREVSGEFVFFLDADDFFEGPLASGLREALEACGADAAFGPQRREWTDGRTWAAPRYGVGPIDPAFLLKSWLRGDFVAPCSVAWRTASVRGIGGWDPAMTRNDDGELIYRAIVKGLKFAGSDKGIGIYYQHDSPYRITRRTDREAFRSELVILHRVEAGIGSGALASARPELARAYYLLARSAYREGHPEIADDALARSRRLGFRGHIGTASHRLGAAALGMKAKERVAGCLVPWLRSGK